MTLTSGYADGRNHAAAASAFIDGRLHRANTVYPQRNSARKLPEQPIKRRQRDKWNSILAGRNSSNIFRKAIVINPVQSSKHRLGPLADEMAIRRHLHHAN